MLNKIINLGISKREALELIKVSKNIEKDYNLLKEGYPIQYLIGYVDFYGYKINVDKNVLIPRYETELLVDKTINLIKKKFTNKIDILDIGTGSGAISIVLSKNINSNVTACDISEKALNMAENNARLNNVNINFIESDLFSNVDSKFDVIISNPPYISYDEEIMESVKKYEPNLALFANNNGLEFYDKILSNITNYLKKNFIIAFEIGYTQANDISNLANKYLKNINLTVEKDFSGRDRYIFITNE